MNVDTLRKVTTKAEQLRDKILSGHNLTAPQFDVLKIVYDNNGVDDISTLANSVNCSRGNLTGIIDRLTRDGWVNRTENAEDRRKKVINCTQMAFGRWPKIIADVRRGESELDGLIDQANLNPVLELLGVAG